MKVGTFCLKWLVLSLVWLLVGVGAVSQTDGQDWSRLPPALAVPLVDQASQTTLNRFGSELLRPFIGRAASSERVPLRMAFQSWDVPILFDEKALEDELISLDEPIARPMPGQTLLDYLDSSLRSVTLSWKPKTGYLFITTRTHESNVVAVYDITRLVDSTNPTPADVNRKLVAIVDAIESSIDPDHWYQNGGDACNRIVKAGATYSLVVNAPFETQRHISMLLATLSRPTSEQSTKRKGWGEAKLRTVRRSMLNSYK